MVERPASVRKQSAFEIFLRTGKIVGPTTGSQNLETKFNPWHDPNNGQFTFAGQGRFVVPGMDRPDRQPSNAPAHNNAITRTPVQNNARRRADPSSQAGSDFRRFHPRHPNNHTIYTARAGDSLSRIAASRTGLSVSDLAWLNGLAPDARLQLGQRLMVPTQAYLDAGRAARRNFINLTFYRDTHDQRLPPDPAHAPSIETQLNSDFRTIRENGYNFDVDLILRNRRTHGELGTAPPERRSRQAQRAAGGADRRPTDDGGHYIAPRFGGPAKPFNHFAQDASFNRGAYRDLERSWDRERDAGHRVFIDIRSYYRGLSLRPFRLSVSWTIDGREHHRDFDNEPRGGRNGRR